MDFVVIFGAPAVGKMAVGMALEKRTCSVKIGPLKEITNWVEACRRHWEASFHRLDKVLEAMKMEKPSGKK